MTHPEIHGETVLVTGGAGFIGSHIAAALVDGNEVRVLDDLSTGRLENVPANVTFIEGDILDEQAVRTAMDGVDIVFHEAAVVEVAESIADPQRSHQVNCNGTLGILEQARLEDARVVLASSAAIYGDPESVPVTEETNGQPLSPYGVQKLTLDRYGTLYADLYDLETVTLRYFNVYGPRGLTGDYSGVIGIFLNNAVDGQTLEVHGDGTQTRDFVHVEDVVRANLRAATTDQVGQAFNIGTGTETEIRDLAEMVVSLADSSAPIEFTDPRSGDISRSAADISSAREGLGFEPTVSLREGLEGLISQRVG